jgi:2-polyprenyl-3-methyl-5-hydroxy-6-metoxy-1,4-benzoquinol methylase
MLRKNNAMKKELRKDIFKWDIYNWSRATNFWESELDLKDKQFYCLDIGAGEGGMSLWLAQKGNKIICSDYGNPEKNAFPIHQKYNVTNFIRYEKIDALSIPYENRFDLVVLKSVLGGIGDNEKVKTAIEQIHKSLKPGGYFLFAENLKASTLHMIARKLFIRWVNEWNYLEYNFFPQTLKIFKGYHLQRFGMFGTFGRNEFQRKMLGKLDKNVFEKILPEKWCYIVAGVARK